MQESLNRKSNTPATQPFCPFCDAKIADEQINLAEGVAQCSVCKSLSQLSELNYSGSTILDSLSRPPHGCAIAQDERRICLKVTLQSTGRYFLLGGVALVWNGTVSLMIAVSMAGLYANLVGPLPEWIPLELADGGKPKTGDGPMGLGTSFCLLAFLAPFAASGGFLIFLTLSSAVGQVEVVICELESYVSTQVGWFEWKKRFDPLHVTSVKNEDLSSSDSRQTVIKINAERSVSFGSEMTDERKEWLRLVLQEILLRPRQLPNGAKRPFWKFLENQKP